jgi:hypothetical protein
MPVPQQYQWQYNGNGVSASNGGTGDADDTAWLSDVLNADDNGDESNSSATDDHAIDDAMVPLPSPLPMANFNM